MRMVMNKIKVLVVDDSRLFREMISRFLNGYPDIQVVAAAGDAFQARDMILRFEPDVMTLDVEMPRMNGIDFLRRLMPQYPIPTVMVSALNATVFDAMKAGAVDFVNKPVQSSPDDIGKWVQGELVPKIRAAAAAQVGQRERRPVKQVVSGGGEFHNKVLAIGASTGGTEAISDVVTNFHTDIPGTVIVQHMPPKFTEMYAERLDKECEVVVREAKDGDLVEKGKILVAPGDKQMRLMRTGDTYRVEVRPGAKVSGHCPSVDVLFESVAKAAGRNAVGVILTGMGADGAKGLLAMRKAGARTIGQNEATCVVYGMPKVAYDIGAVEKQVPLEYVANTVYNVLRSSFTQ